MSNVTSANQVLASSTVPPLRQLAAAAEPLLVYSGILFYIWRWQFTLPALWVLPLAVIVTSHFAHRESLRDLGLTWSAARSGAEVVLPLMLALYLPLLVYGFAYHRLQLILPDRHALQYFVAYGSWCVFQEYLLQSYFNNRLMALVRNRRLSSALAGLMFGAAHIPNPVLMVATAVAGFIFAEVFARYRSIWPLALAQTVGGFLIGAVLPAALVHNMRVGPGYFFYGLR